VKDWDHYVAQTEEVARSKGFQELRDHILDRAAPSSGDVVLDLGAGTGLLTMQLAPRVERVWAIDISPLMTQYLETKAKSAGLENVRTATASACNLPLIDGCVDLVVSNYCFHHLANEDKLRTLREVHRVLRPGGRLTFADMMFGLGAADPRDRRIVAEKVRAMLRKGAPGVIRLGKNGLRFIAGRWESPARPEWWKQALEGQGFVNVTIEPLHHEGGVATAVRP
jgi:ubiquinone/menaquinone biosynthesis C-methylase UbiE